VDPEVELTDHVMDLVQQEIHKGTNKIAKKQKLTKVTIFLLILMLPFSHLNALFQRPCLFPKFQKTEKGQKAI